MSWVKDMVNKEREASAFSAAKPYRYTPQPPAWLPVWDAIDSAVRRAVSEFNQERGSDQFKVRSQKQVKARIEVLPGIAGRRIVTAVLQVTNEHSGELNLTCPPEGEGIGRHGNFRMREDNIEALLNFVGKPQPPQTMTPGEFARFILQPMLFPQRTGK